MACDPHGQGRAKARQAGTRTRRALRTGGQHSREQNQQVHQYPQVERHRTGRMTKQTWVCPQDRIGDKLPGGAVPLRATVVFGLGLPGSSLVLPHQCFPELISWTQKRYLCPRWVMVSLISSGQAECRGGELDDGFSGTPESPVGLRVRSAQGVLLGANEHVLLG